MGQDYIHVGTEKLSLPDANRMMMETLGFMCMRSVIPPEEKMAEVEKLFDRNEKYSSQSFRYCKGGAECKEFIHSETPVSPSSLGLTDRS